MISYIRGTLVEKTPARIVIEAQGVGYEIFIPLSSYDLLGDVGEEVSVYTHFHVREDAHQLYGFATEKERAVFRMLLSVSGIGPRLALSILSGINVDSLCEAIEAEEIDFLTAISGIGKKTAQRLVVELKERVRGMVEVGGRLKDTTISEAIDALTALGFTRNVAKKAVEKAISEVKDKQDLEELIRSALKHT